MRKRQRESGAMFGRADVARLLNIPPWLLANFADYPRYPYGLAPSVRGGKGRGKKGFYSLADMYMIATAYRMHLCGFSASIVARAVKELFPNKSDVNSIAVEQRATTAEDARYIVIDFALAPWLEEGKSPDEWRGSNPKQRAWVRLETRREMASTFSTDELRATFEIPFDALLNWVDSRILGRTVGFGEPRRGIDSTSNRGGA